MTDKQMLAVNQVNFKFVQRYHLGASAWLRVRVRAAVDRDSVTPLSFNQAIVDSLRSEPPPFDMGMLVQLYVAECE